MPPLRNSPVALLLALLCAPLSGATEATPLNFASQGWKMPDGYVVEDRGNLYHSKDGLNFRLVQENSDSDVAGVFPGSDGKSWSVARYESLETLRPDGTEAAPSISLEGRSLFRAIAGPGKVLALVSGGRIYQARPGEAWSPANAPADGVATDGAYGKGLWVLAGYEGKPAPEHLSRAESEAAAAKAAAQWEEADDVEGEKGAGVGEPSKSPAALWVSSDGSSWQRVKLPESVGLLQLWQLSSNSRGFFAVLEGDKAVVSADGRNWSVVKAPYTNQDHLHGVSVVGDEFAIKVSRGGGTELLFSADGRTWRTERIQEGAELASLIAGAPQSMALARPHTSQPMRIAPLSEFQKPWKAPAPIAAAPAAKSATPPTTALATPSAKPPQAPQVAPPQSTPQELWVEALIRWDTAVATANRATRLSLTRDLHRAWLKSNPQATQEARMAYLRSHYFRLVGYEVNDDMIYGYVDLCEELQAGLGIAFTKTLTPEVQKGVREIAAQRVAVAAAQQRKQPPPAQRSIFKSAQTAPSPSTQPEDLDLANLRRRALRGEAAAAYDLGMSHEKGYGTPVDKSAAAYWLMRAHEGGFNFEGSKVNTPEGHTATWKRQADDGSVLAMLMYALNLRDGVGVQADQAAANTWLRRAMEAGHRDAAVHLALQLREGQGCDIDLEGSRRLLEELAPTGHPRVLCELGRVHEGGAGVPRNFEKAAELFLKAAQKNYPWAMRRIADCLLEGRGVAKDPAEAKRWLEKAAALGDAPAQKALTELNAGQYKPVAAYRYEPPPEERAVFDIEARRKLAEAGNAAACYDLAYAHWQGLGVRKNTKEGNRWNERAKAAGWKLAGKWNTYAEITESWRQYGEQGSVVGLGRYALSAPGNPAETLAILQRAAEAGYAPAQERLASRYRDGLGTAADEAKAIEWFRRAAALGNAQAQGYLAYAHETGRGVTKSEQEAARLYRLAAEGGDRLAMANLANVVFHGKGQAAQPREAAAWYLLLAGLPKEEMEPEEAAQRIRAKAEQGDPGSYEAWAIMLRRGFGTPVNNEEGFAYGFTAVGMNMAAYPARWFEPAALKRPVALRRAATVSIKAYNFRQAENSKQADYAAKIANGTIPTIERIMATAKRDDSTTVRALKAISENRLTAELAADCEMADEALALPGLSFLHEEALKRPELAGQTWLLRLSGVAEKAADAAAVEKLFQAALLAPAPDQDTRERLQTLRRLAAARLYHGIGRAQDKPAALAWAMLSVDTVSDLLALELMAAELNAEQVGLADALFERILSRLAPAPAGG